MVAYLAHLNVALMLVHGAAGNSFSEQEVRKVGGMCGVWVRVRECRGITVHKKGLAARTTVTAWVVQRAHYWELDGAGGRHGAGARELGCVRGRAVC